MTDDLAERGHLAMADRFRLGTQLEGGDGIETAGALLYAGRSDFPVLTNGAIRLDADADPQALVDAARDFFAERERGFTLLVREHADADLEPPALAAGMQLVLERYPAMVRREPFEPRVLPEGVELRRVRDEAGARDYAGVADAAFTSLGMPAGLLAQLPAEGFLRDDSAAFVAYEGGRSLAAASVVVARGIGGIQWVAVLEEARGRGLADACTRAAVNAGFELGAELGWLEASSMGEPVYLRMGFEEVFNYRMYLAAPPA